MEAPTDIIRPQPGPQEEFLSCDADIAIYGGAAGSGKTFAELLEPLRYTLTVPGFNTLILRRTTKEVRNVGGLWNEAETLYSQLGAVAKVGDLKMEFPNGNEVKFDHMEHEHDKLKYQGSQIALIEFDELTHFTETQFWYMLSRNRSICGVKPYIRATCNPDASSWVAKLIDWWIDPRSGYPIPERSGVWRWFVRNGGLLVWGDSREELIEKFPASTPKSLTFIAATLDDNPALTSKDPGYRANLESLPHVEQERLLRGNWKIVDTEGAEWPPEYFFDLDFRDWPTEDELVWKVIAADPALGKTDRSDYSAIVMLALGKDGLVYVDADIERRDVVKLADALLAHNAIFLPHAVAVETNGFNALVELIVERAGGMMPPLAKVTQHRDKVARIKVGLTPYLSHRKFRFRSHTPGCALLLQMLQAFPIHDFDDGPDALESGIQVLRKLSAGVDAEPLAEMVTT